MKMEVTLSPEEIKEIIKIHLFEKFKTVGDVKIKVEQELRGHGYNEYYVSVFNGAVVEVEL